MIVSYTYSSDREILIENCWSNHIDYWQKKWERLPLIHLKRKENGSTMCQEWIYSKIHRVDIYSNLILVFFAFGLKINVVMEKKTIESSMFVHLLRSSFPLSDLHSISDKWWCLSESFSHDRISCFNQCHSNEKYQTILSKSFGKLINRSK